jgi:hypothetical protein
VTLYVLSVHWYDHVASLACGSQPAADAGFADTSVAAAAATTITHHDLTTRSSVPWGADMGKKWSMSPPPVVSDFGGLGPRGSRTAKGVA